jgi:hypothetical protein
MPLTFDEAYAIVCPDGRTVNPGCQDFKDIQELMRQSGHVHFQDRLVIELVPRPAKNVLEVRRFLEQPTREPSKKLSKRQWLSVAANRDCFMKCLNKNNNSPSI